jgi:hypothetical protein
MSLSGLAVGMVIQNEPNQTVSISRILGHFKGLKVDPIES